MALHFVTNNTVKSNQSVMIINYYQYFKAPVVLLQEALEDKILPSIQP